MSVKVVQASEPKITPCENVTDAKPFTGFSAIKQISSMNELEKYRLKNAPPTMYYIPDFFGKKDEKNLVNAIESVPPSKWTVNECYKQDWGRVHHPDGQVFRDGGDLPDWAEQTIACITPLELFFSAGTQDRFLHISKYTPGQGIDPHRDFQNGPMTASFTLNSPGLLDFYYPSKKSFDICNETDAEERRRRYIGSVWMEPRSLFIFTDVAYDVLWHGMKKEKFDVMTDKVFNRPADLAVGSKIERGVRYCVGNYSNH